MSDSRSHEDQKLPSIDGVDTEHAPSGALAKNMLASLLALLLLVGGVGVISYRAGRASWQRPTGSAAEALHKAEQSSTTPLTNLPQPALPLPSDVEPPPPVARILQAQARLAADIAEKETKRQSVIPETPESHSPRTREFRPPRRVLEARRALVQPKRVLYASRVVQLGEYPNRRQAEAAHARLVRVYPYLKTLPKTVKSWRPPAGGARAYHLRLEAFSPDHARVLCQNLLAIGRGCAVLPERT